MTNLNLSRLGAINGVTPKTNEEANALFKKVFGGEVLTAFNENNIFADLHIMRSCKNGNGVYFPTVWKADAKYHKPGTPILGDNNIEVNEVYLKPDDLLYSSVSISKIDEVKNHFDARSIYTKQLGEALARTFDMKVAQVLTKAARQKSGITKSAPGGYRVVNKEAATSVDALIDSIRQAAINFDKKDIPKEDRFVVLRPEQYYLLLSHDMLINQQYSKDNGDFATARIKNVLDFKVFTSNNLPSGKIEKVEGENNDYSGDFSNTVALAFHKSAIGTVKLMDLDIEHTNSDFNVMYQSTLIVAKYAMGHGILRPEAAVEIATA